ncbi:MAG: helix-turn-helix transcriptional regulator [Lachnospiraceae bacterium]
MSFINLLTHALTEIPVTTISMPITYYLPKNTTIDSASSAYLFYPQASGHIRMPAGLHLSFRPLPSYGMLYVAQGTGSLSSGSRHEALSGNCFVLFDCRDGFSFTAATSLEYDLLYFDGSSMPYFYEVLSKNNCLFLPSLSASGLGGHLRPLLPDGAQTLSAFTFHRLLTDLLTELVEYSSVSEGSTAIPDYLRQLKEYLDENFFKDISLELLEKQFCVNRYRLCREFRTYYFLPPLQYLHTARIAKAKVLLAETTLKIHEIGYQVGYENTNQFIHHFKKITGRTPAVYRERKR